MIRKGATKKVRGKKTPGVFNEGGLQGGFPNRKKSLRLEEGQNEKRRSIVKQGGGGLNSMKKGLW